MVLTRINNNVSAINANRNLNGVSTDLSRSLERLSSGLRINRASDDAAGLSISERQRSQIRGLNRAVSNSQDAIGLINTAEGALNETTSRLQRVRELAVQALNSGGQDSDAIQAAQDEIETSIQEISRIAETTQYSTRVLLNGDNNNSVAVRQNTPDRGVAVAQTSVASSLPNGTAFLRVTQTQVGTEVVSAGTDGALNAQITDVTGSTFASGSYSLSISNVQQAAIQNVQTSTLASLDGTGIDTAETLDSLSINGRTIATTDDISVSLTLNDGSTATVSATGATSVGQFLSDIQAALGGAGEGATYTTAVDGSVAETALLLTAGATGASSLGYSISIDSNDADTLAEFTNIGSVTQLGTANQAVLSLDNGVAVTAEAGSTATLYGRETSDGSATPRATFTFGSTGFVSEGTETLNVTQGQFTGSLNGGRSVTFAAGDQEVLFRSGNAAGASSGDFLVLNFEETIDLSGTPAVDLSATVIFSSANRGLNFQIGANAGQDLSVALSDMRANKLGYVEGLNVNGDSYNGTVDTIDVRTQSGAENAIRIVDRAISQVARQRSYLGATTNRLEATIANLGVSSENLTAAESRIRDADIASETTKFTRNQILVQAATSILAQANSAPQGVLQLLR